MKEHEHLLYSRNDPLDENNLPYEMHRNSFSERDNMDYSLVENNDIKIGADAGAGPNNDNRKSKFQNDGRAFSMECTTTARDVDVREEFLETNNENMSGQFSIQNSNNPTSNGGKSHSQPNSARKTLSALNLLKILPHATGSSGGRVVPSSPITPNEAQRAIKELASLLSPLKESDSSHRKIMSTPRNRDNSPTGWVGKLADPSYAFVSPKAGKRLSLEEEAFLPSTVKKMHEEEFLPSTIKKELRNRPSLPNTPADSTSVSEGFFSPMKLEKKNDPQHFTPMETSDVDMSLNQTLSDMHIDDKDVSNSSSLQAKNASAQIRMDENNVQYLAAVEAQRQRTDTTSSNSGDEKKDQNDGPTEQTPINNNTSKSEKNNVTSLSAATSPSSDHCAAAAADNCSFGLYSKFCSAKDPPKYTESELESKIEATVYEEREHISRLIKERDSMAQMVEEMKSQHQTELEQMKQEREERKSKIEEEMTAHLSSKFEALTRDADSLMAKKEETLNALLSSQTSEITASYEEKIKILEAALQQERKEREMVQARIQQSRDEHTNEIDEMIAQLDEVVAEHDRKFNAMQSLVNQKEVIIKALGSQLAEANAKNLAMEKEGAEMKEMLEQKEREVDDLKTMIGSMQKLMDNMKLEHEKSMEDEIKLRRHAVQKKASEMRAAAEEQFRDANKYYLLLKSEYDASQKEIEKLKKGKENAQAKIDALAKERKAKEVSLNAEIAQLKASLATAEAKLAKTTQNYTHELESIKEEKRLLNSKCEEANANCSSAHMSLATLVAAKERLEKENRELNGVCEELMAMVEGQAGKG